MLNKRYIFSSLGDNQRPCELTCIAIGFNFYKTFGPVRDGTRCYEDKYDMCIEGACMVSLLILAVIV